ncbi:MAG: restriction endonuclease [Desulfobacteraceae bacterium]|nr:restriction endonuclease [Desulfobacteraceae bacterium]MCP4348046.1 restriction endonuclease [Desulfobacterales bacterium]
MLKSDEYVRIIKNCNREDLISLWKMIKSGNTPGWPPGKAFEYLVLRAFQLDGSEVTWPYSVNIGESSEEVEQIDGVVYVKDICCIVECKDSSSRINIEPISKLRNQLLRRPSSAIGAVFSRNGFTNPAHILAQFLFPQTILLWVGDEVEIALKNGWMCKGLIKKYRLCVEKGIPDYHIQLGVA